MEGGKIPPSYIVMINVNSNFLKILATSDGSIQQTMGFILCYNHKLILIDGGAPSESAHLIKNFDDYKGEIDYLILTHAHLDHYGALIPLLKSNIIIRNIIYDFAPMEETLKFTPDHEKDKFIEFTDVLNKKNINHIIPYKDLCLNLNGIKIQFLNNRYKMVHDLNESSICFKIYLDNDKSILFLGDLDPSNSDVLADEVTKEVLHSTYCQLAHHGQSGGSYKLYEKISPKFAIWCCPKDNYNNDWGNGFNTGPLTSVETRKWMEKLGVINILPFDNDVMINLK